jgi:hypothetical protein
MSKYQIYAVKKDGKYYGRCFDMRDWKDSISDEDTILFDRRQADECASRYGGEVVNITAEIEAEARAKAFKEAKQAIINAPSETYEDGGGEWLFEWDALKAIERLQKQEDNNTEKG